MDVVWQICSVGFVLALVCGFAYWIRRGTPMVRMASRGRRVRVAGRTALTAQHVVHLIEIDGEEWVVGTHPQGLTVLKRGAPEDRQAV